MLPHNLYSGRFLGVTGALTTGLLLATGEDAKLRWVNEVLDPPGLSLLLLISLLFPVLIDFMVDGKLIELKPTC